MPKLYAKSVPNGKMYTLVDSNGSTLIGVDTGKKEGSTGMFLVWDFETSNNVYCPLWENLEWLGHSMDSVTIVNL